MDIDSGAPTDAELIQRLTVLYRCGRSKSGPARAMIFGMRQRSTSDGLDLASADETKRKRSAALNGGHQSTASFARGRTEIAKQAARAGGPRTREFIHRY